jgi:protoheme IX farnesyltransferase
MSVPLHAARTGIACAHAWRALRARLRLFKPALVAMVALTASAGFCLAGRGAFDPSTFLALMLGTLCAAAGANALNQWQEARLDGLMRRTAGRPIPAGELGSRGALCLALGASLLGLGLLALRVNAFVAALGLLAECLYVGAYTPLKRRTLLCTLVGALCGATPALMGWAGARGELEYGAWLLAAILFVWQVPHFLALAWTHREDFRLAGFRVWPAVDPGGRCTAQFCVLYSLVLASLSLCLPLARLASWVGASAALAAASLMVALSARLYRNRGEADARALFRASLAYLPLTFLAAVADAPTW